MRQLTLLLLTGCLVSLAAQDLDLGSLRRSTMGEAAVRYDGGAIDIRLDRTDAQVHLRPPQGTDSWDFSAAKELVLELENPADRQMRITLRLRVGDRTVDTGAALNPGERRELRIGLPHPLPIDLPEGTPQLRTIDTARISAIEFYLQWPLERSAPGVLHCRLLSLRTQGEAVPPELPPVADYFPFVDRYGQFAHGSWPTKITADAQLAAAHAKELAELDASPRPAAWNEYGGWADGPQLEATGHFRVEKVDGKWFFVDPSGRLFFSHGIDVARRYTDAMNTRGHEGWYALDPVPEVWQPVESNLRRKYGSSDYVDAFNATLERRLTHWGMNTIGNWTTDDILLATRTPYVFQITDFNWKLPRIGDLKFYDVYDPRYVAHMATIFEKRIAASEAARRSVDDPYCIGYFIDNELKFQPGPRGRLAELILACPPTQAAKIELRRWLRERHGDDIASLNAAWETSYGSWDEFLDRREAPGNRKHRRDTDPFISAMVERYFEICRDAIKRTAPHRLYLGTRFIGGDSAPNWLAEICARHSDVLSVNIYAHSVANFPLDDYPDIPVLIGEFHFGVLQRGMFRPGLCLVGVDDQDRAIAYTRFLEGALAHPLIVGAHWFQFRDQPLLGRGDGEAYQIGFVDVADTPYQALTQAARHVGERMYQLRAGSPTAP